ncbi:MAG: hypothetical protein ACOY3I_06375 [Verrucomicrobiota bacterium]
MNLLNFNQEKRHLSVHIVVIGVEDFGVGVDDEFAAVLMSMPLGDELFVDACDSHKERKEEILTRQGEAGVGG